MNGSYSIIDLHGYATQIRDAAAKSLSDHSEEDNLDNYIRISEIINFVQTECIGFDDEDRPILNEDINENIFNSTVIWIHNIGLAKLAAQDLIECAWDNDTNEMMFWSKQKEKKSNGKQKPRRKNMGDKK